MALINDDDDAHTLTGGTGPDTLNGNGGDDTIAPGRGDYDYVNGGSGNDLLIIDYSTNTFAGEHDGMNFGWSGGDGLASAPINFFVGEDDAISFRNMESAVVTATASAWDVAYDLNLSTGSVGGTFDNTAKNVTYGVLNLKGFERFTDVTLAGGADNVVLTGVADDSFWLGAGNDTFYGGRGGDFVDGGNGIDLLIIDYSTNTYTGEGSGMTLRGEWDDGSVSAPTQKYWYVDRDSVDFYGIERFDVTGTRATDSLQSGNGSDILRGGGGNDTLDGGGGSNTLVGGIGNDTYVIGVITDHVIEAAGEGIDLVQSAVSGYTLEDNVENLTLVWIAETATGNALDNIITGNTGKNTLDGGTGADTLIGGAGDDTFFINVLTDVVTEAVGQGTDLVQSNVSGYTLTANVEKLTLTGTAATGTGNTLNNVLTGNAAANTLNGGTGRDTLIGASGNDTYRVDMITDVVTEAANEGADLVRSAVTGYTLAANVENLILLGSVASGRGNTLNNLITGNTSANSLDGGLGRDTLVGLQGNDTYVIDALTDVVREASGEGTDLVLARVSGYTLAANVEKLTLTGNARVGTGNSLNNTLTGNASANTLSGGAGRDTLVGLAGDDTYLIDVLTDAVTEAANQGTDLVQSSVSGYGLKANLENLTLTGSAVTGTGNTLDNVLIGNSSANTLNGGAGSDTLMGLQGNDTYVIDALTDVVTEASGEGTADLVLARVSGYILAANVEKLTLTGNAEVGTGNILNNTLTGNTSANTLSGGAGRDTLVGLAGNDTYVIDVLTDVVTEIAGAGTDLVKSSVSGYALTTNVENLTLIGSATAGTGNSLNNVLTGNAGANTFDGGAGNDNITAAGGRDSLLGGMGNDALTGADLTTRGVGEVDTLTGAANNDRFLLGDSAGRFYDDGNAASTGTGDYALITDFTPGADRLQLKGTAAQYFLGASPVAGVTGTALFFDSTGAPGGTDELIAIIQSPSTLTAANVITPALFV